MTRVRDGLAIAALLIHGVDVHASETDAARSDAENGTATLESRPCPAFGDRQYLRRMSEPQQLVAAADRERTYQEGALRQLQQMMRDANLGQQQRSELQALASWSIAASMANWSTLQVARQALANPLIASDQPYPAAGIEGARDRVRQTADGNSMTPDAAQTMRRMAGALDRCAKTFEAAVYKLNQPQLAFAIDGAKSSSELDRVAQQYRLRDAVDNGYGAESSDRLNVRRAELADAERAARDTANAANAVDAAKRQGEMQKRQAEMRALLPAHLAAAKRFTDASQGGNERAALAELARDVVMSTPTGTYRGIDQVVGAVRQQSASGQKGSLGTPRIEGDRVIANGSSGAYRLTTTFGFNDEGRISRIDISL